MDNGYNICSVQIDVNTILFLCLPLIDCPNVAEAVIIPFQSTVVTRPLRPLIPQPDAQLHQRTPTFQSILHHLPPRQVSSTFQLSPPPACSSRFHHPSRTLPTAALTTLHASRRPDDTINSTEYRLRRHRRPGVRRLGLACPFGR